MIPYFLFEFAIGLVSVVVTLAFRGETSSPALLLLSILVFRALIGSIIPMGLGFLRRLDGRHVRDISLALILLSVVAVWHVGIVTRRDLLWLADSIRSEPLSAAVAAVGGIVLIPLLRANVSSIVEFDSVLSFKFILAWLTEKKTPYTMDFEYPSLWECRLSIPILCQREYGGSEGFLVVPQFEAALIFAVALYKLTLIFVPVPALCMLVAVHGVAIWLFWSPPSGLASLKNDTVYGAGILIEVLGLALMASGAAGFVPYFLFVSGAAFVLVKYSGILLAPTIGGIFAIVIYILQSPPLLRFGAEGLLAILLAGTITGHYYIKNVVKFRNPLYPVEIKMLGLVLPGWAKLGGTSIMSALADKGTRLQAVKYLLGRHEFNGRFLFPVGLLVLPAILVTIAVMIVLPFRLLRSGAVIPQDLILLAISICALIGLASYLVTVGSASQWGKPGDLGHLRRLNSARYALAPIGLVIVVAVAGLGSISPWGLGFVAAILLVDTLFRLAPAYKIWWLRFKDCWRLWLVTGGAAGIVIGAAFIEPDVSVFLLLAFIVAGLTRVPDIAIRAPSTWRTDVEAVQVRIDDLPSARIFVATEIEFLGRSVRLFHSHYLFAGALYQHLVRSGPLSQLRKLIDAGWVPNLVVGYDLWERRDFSGAIGQTLAAELNELGFVPIVLGPLCFEFERRPVQEIRLLAKKHSPSSLPQAPVPAILSLAPSRAVVHTPGAGIAHSNPNLLLELTQPFVEIDEASVNAIRSIVSVSSAVGAAGLGTNKVGPGWHVWSTNGHEVNFVIEEGRTILRIVASEETRALALVYRLGPSNRIAPISLVSRVRSVGPTPINQHAFDYIPTENGKLKTREIIDKIGIKPNWGTYALSLPFKGGTGGERLAVGAFPTKAGDGIEIEFSDIIELALHSIDVSRRSERFA